MTRDVHRIVLHSRNRWCRLEVGVAAALCVIGSALPVVAQGTPTGEVESGAAKAAELTAGGTAMMTLSLLFVWILTFWCFKRVLTTPSATDPGPAAKP
jgi:hypothetical protein